MTGKIFRSTMILAVLVLVCSLGIVTAMLYSHFSLAQVAQLKDELSLAVTGTEQYGNAFLENVESSRFRLTWIDTDGTVLFDTQFEQTGMENHSGREEFQEALGCGTGSSTRYSDTLMEKTFYEARQLRDGTVLRISNSQASVGALVLEMVFPMILVAVAAICLCAFFSKQVAKWIVEPLNRLDLEKPAAMEAYPEITPLLRRITQQHIQIEAQIQTLKQKADEFQQITANMREGLVLLDGGGQVLSINPTAAALFGTDGSCVGKSIWMIDSSSKLRDAVNDALDTGHGSTLLHRSGKDYRMDMNRIESDGKILGAVLLAFDITQTLQAERARQEFSANVSHELKTPLQSIMGSAELLESGLVKPEDSARFLGYIRTESARLLSLIEDIIRLSQLDEGIALSTEDVDLLDLAREVADVLTHTAKKKAVSLGVSGESRTVNGVRRLLYEILYNLCDNAIKYNVSGGSVRILVSEENEKTVLCVSDTGIGIPQEHQEQIFERFYRVDKSHSKQSGGTGLGLSIVKHAAAYHKASIHLQSTPGEGTTVKITF